MSGIVYPKPEFEEIGEAEVLRALQDCDPDNKIAREVARLIAGYTANFARHVEQLGRVPEDVLRAKPRTAIEAIAMQLTIDTIRQSLSENAR